MRRWWAGLWPVERGRTVSSSRCEHARRHVEQAAQLGRPTLGQPARTCLAPRVHRPRIKAGHGDHRIGAAGAEPLEDAYQGRAPLSRPSPGTEVICARPDAARIVTHIAGVEHEDQQAAFARRSRQPRVVECHVDAPEHSKLFLHDSKCECWGGPAVGVSLQKSAFDDARFLIDARCRDGMFSIRRSVDCFDCRCLSMSLTPAPRPFLMKLIGPEPYKLVEAQVCARQPFDRLRANGTKRTALGLTAATNPLTTAHDCVAHRARSGVICASTAPRSRRSVL